MAWNLTVLSAGACGAVGALAVSWITLRSSSGPPLGRVTWAGIAGLLVAVLAAVGQRRLGWTLAFALLLAELGLLTQVAIDDLRRQVVLNAVTYPGAIVALLAAPVAPGLSRGSALAGAVFAAIPFLVVALARPAGVGMGDAKLAFAAGAMAGLLPGFRILVIMGVSLAGALGASVALLLLKRATARTALPLGSFMAVATMVVLATLPP